MRCPLQSRNSTGWLARQRESDPSCLLLTVMPKTLGLTSASGSYSCMILLYCHANTRIEAVTPIRRRRRRTNAGQ